MKIKSTMTTSALATSLLLAACGSKSKSDTPPSDQSNTASSADPAALAKSPNSQDLALNDQTQAQVAQSGLDSAASGAAAGLTGTSATATLTLGLADAAQAGLDGSPVLGQPVEKVTTGSVSRDCYLGSTLQGRTGPLTWPESTDASSIFADSKNDANPLNMSVEPLLLQYPAQSPTTTLTLAAPFAFANLAEVIQKDNRATDLVLNDLAQSHYTQTSGNEEHRFWVAANPMAGQTGAAVVCGLKTATASGSYAKIKWSDNQQVNGLSLLARFSNSGFATRTYLPRKKGVYATTAVTTSSNFGSTGYRLVQWSIASADANEVPGAAFVRQKKVTHTLNRLDQAVDAQHTVLSDVSHIDQIRAADPLVILDYRDAAEKPLAQIIKSGTIFKTANDSAGNPKWFSTLAYNGVEFDLVKSNEVCIPVAGSVVMTIFDKEGGTQKGQITITYSSVASSGGKIDPQIAVSGDDADGTKAKLMMLAVNRKCDLK